MLYFTLDVVVCADAEWIYPSQKGTNVKNDRGKNDSIGFKIRSHLRWN